MFDIFGIGARAEAKVLRETLALERKRIEKLELDLVALADVKAHRSIITPPRAPTVEALVPTTRRGMVTPGHQRSVNATVAAIREDARLKES